MVSIGKEREKKIMSRYTERARIGHFSHVHEDSSSCWYTFDWRGKTRTCTYDKSSACASYDSKSRCIYRRYFCGRPSYDVRYDKEDPDDVVCEYRLKKGQWRVLFGFGVTFLVIGCICFIAGVVGILNRTFG